LVAGAALAGVVLLVLLVAAALRWRSLNRRPGAFVCVLIEGTGARRRELPGVARFTPGSLDWYRRGSLVPRPAHSWPRRSLVMRVWSLDDDPAVGALADSPWEVVRLTAGDQDYLMVLSRSAESGLISWKEAGPTRSEPTLPR
jgi:hypothetical protein